MKVDLLADHRAFARANAFHLHACVRRIDAVLLAVVRDIRDLRAADDVLAREARDVRARAADQPALDHHDRLALLRQRPREVLARLTATEDHIPHPLVSHVEG
jgi:hypothetical protein